VWCVVAVYVVLPEHVLHHVETHEARGRLQVMLEAARASRQRVSPSVDGGAPRQLLFFFSR